MPDIFIDEKPIKQASVETKPEDNNKAVGKEKFAPKSLSAQKNGGHKHYHIFTSFCERPPNVNFSDVLEDEELLLFLRKHFVTNVPWIIKAIGFALIPFIISIITSLTSFKLNFLPSNYLMMIVIFYYFLVFGYIFANYITWFYNISLVTTQRIIDIDFSSIVFENVAATKLAQVEDVSYSQIGVIRSVFDYGDVTVQTAGTLSEFVSHAVPHPEKVINIINNLIGDANNA